MNLIILLIYNMNLRLNVSVKNLQVLMKSFFLSIEVRVNFDIECYL